MARLTKNGQEIKVISSVITENGLQIIDNPSEFRYDFDAMPQHKKESFMIRSLEMIQKWAAAQEAASDGVKLQQ